MVGDDGNVNSSNTKLLYELGYYPTFPSMVTRTDVLIKNSYKNILNKTVF